jgi:hypothetical protein
LDKADSKEGEAEGKEEMQSPEKQDLVSSVLGGR